MTGGGASRSAARWQWQLALWTALLLAAVTTASVSAHADLIASEPAAGSTVPGSPNTIRLSFSQPLQGTSTIQLFTGQFQPVTGLTTSVAGSELQALVGQRLEPATYTVQWSAATDDGHTTEGSFQFAVAATSSNPLGRLTPLLAVFVALLGVGVTGLAWMSQRRRRL